MKARALLLLLFAIYCFFAFKAIELAEPLLLAYASRNWPVASATVDRSELNGHCSRSGGFNLSLKFTYTVEGRTYSGWREAFGTKPCESESDALERSHRYKVGTNITVSYSPRSPEQSVVLPGELPTEDYWTTAFVLTLMLFATWKLWAARRADA
jgi:Protein of unknown function (DUF3592)